MAAVSSKEGLRPEELESLADFENSELFDETDRLVLRYATQMSNTPVRVDDDLFRGLAERFNEKQLVELTAAISFENFRARMNHAFEIGSAGFADSMNANVAT